MYGHNVLRMNISVLTSRAECRIIIFEYKVLHTRYSQNPSIDGIFMNTSAHFTARKHLAAQNTQHGMCKECGEFVFRQCR